MINVIRYVLVHSLPRASTTLTTRGFIRYNDRPLVLRSLKKPYHFAWISTARARRPTDFIDESNYPLKDAVESSWEPEIEDFEMLERSWSNATPSLAELVREDIPSARQFFRKVLQAKYPKELGMWNKWAVMVSYSFII